MDADVQLAFLPMRYILVPHTGHFPIVAGLPFFIVTSCGSLIARCVRHFRQYASTTSPFQLARRRLPHPAPLLVAIDQVDEQYCEQRG